MLCKPHGMTRHTDATRVAALRLSMPEQFTSMVAPKVLGPLPGVESCKAAGSTCLQLATSLRLLLLSEELQCGGRQVGNTCLSVQQSVCRNDTARGSLRVLRVLRPSSPLFSTEASLDLAGLQKDALVQHFDAVVDVWSVVVLQGLRAAPAIALL